MASTVFVDNSSIIYASWLNDVNSAVYNGTFISSTITPSNLVCNGSVSGTGFTGLVNNTLSAPGQIGNGTPNTGAFTTLSTSGLATLSSLTVSGSTTLVTPNLGTPSTLVGTNITGTANALNAGLGVNQTWQNVTGTRSLNADQTNGTSKPIEVVVSMTSSNGGGSSNTTTATALVGGVTVAYGQNSDSSGFYSTPITFSFIVPAGAIYRVNTTAGSGTSISLNQWAELR
jgi:hypothetical protein